MEKFKVIDPNGIHVDGVHHKPGKLIELGKGAATNAFLHFQQVERLEESKPAVKPLEASDAARKLAEEKGIDLATVTGTGAGGAITKPDVEAAIEAAAATGGLM